MTSQAVDRGITPDATISRMVKAMCAYHGLKVEDIAGSLGMTKSTLYRRHAEGGWYAREVAAIAHYFGCAVGDIYGGTVVLTDTSVTVSNPGPAPRGPGGKNPRRVSDYGLMFHASAA
jgi:hypothetical protein